MTLKELVAALEEPLRRTLSHILITFDGREAVAFFQFRALIPATSVSSIDGEEEVCQAALPQNSQFRGDASRLHPGRAYSLSLAPSLDDQCHDLHGSALVGNLHVERQQCSAEEVGQGHPIVTWTITTHAGSECERLDWGRDLLHRNLFRLTQPNRNENLL